MKCIKQIILITVIMFSLPVIAAEKQRVWQVVSNKNIFDKDELALCGYAAKNINERMKKKPQDCMKTGACETSFLPEYDDSIPDYDPSYHWPMQLVEFSGSDTSSMRINVDPDVRYDSFLADGQKYDLVQQPTEQIGDSFWNGKLMIAPAVDNPKADFQNFMAGAMICGGGLDELGRAACRTAATIHIESIVNDLNETLNLQNYKTAMPPLPNRSDVKAPFWMTANRFIAWIEKLPDAAKSDTVLMAFTSGKFWMDDVDYPAYFIDQGINPRIALAYIRYDEHADTLANAFDIRPISSCLLEQKK
jgi:hypothetical protein